MAASVTPNASNEAIPNNSNNKQSNSMKHMGGGGDNVDDGNSRKSSSLSIVANEEQQKQKSNGVRQSATPATQYDVEHLATFSTTSSHETTPMTSNHVNGDALGGGGGGGGNGKSDTGELAITQNTKPTSSDSSSSTTTTTTKTTNVNANANSTSVAGEPRVALQKLFELEKLSGIWTQRMQIQLSSEFMLILDCETNSIVERFHRNRVTKPESFNQYNDIYNNIIVFIIEPDKFGTEALPNSMFNTKSSSSSSQKIVEILNETKPLKKSETTPQQVNGETKDQNYDQTLETAIKTSGELHIFQCVSHQAQQLVDHILTWKSSTHLAEDKISPERRRRSQDDDTITQARDATIQESSRVSVVQKEKESGDMASNKLVALSESGLTKGPLVAITSANGANVSVSAPTAANENVPIVNVNVKETVQVFNQIAALREKGANNQVVPRPLSSSELTNSSTVTSDNLTRAPGEPAAFYKQRSIRATLAPNSSNGNKPDGSSDQMTKGLTDLNSTASASTSSSSGATVPTTKSAELQNGNGKPSTTSSSSSSASSASSSSRSADGNNHKVTTTTSNKLPPTSNHKNQHRADNNNQATAKLLLHNKEANSNKTANSSKQQQSTSASSSSASSTARSQPPQQSDSSRGSHASPSSQLEQVTTNESYVSVLNHCFDDIEKFIIRLQHAYTAIRELQAKRRQSKRSNHQLALAAAAAAASASNQQQQQQQNGGGNKSQAALPPVPLTASELAMLSARARGPTADDFFEILSKFKLAFNLLAKLKGCIHEPNAPELVHFLFTPLAIIIESARNVSPPVDPTVVGIPYLNKEALDLLSNCCTSKESDLWLSLGPNWTQTIDIQILKASRLPSSFQPIFSDGWAPVIGELELIGLVPPPPLVVPLHELDQHYRSSRALCAPPPQQTTSDLPDSSEPSLMSGRHYNSRGGSKMSSITHSNGGAGGPNHVTDHHNHHKKRNSPTANGSARNQHQHYLDPIKSQLSPTPYGYLAQQRDSINEISDLTGDQLNHQYGGGHAQRLHSSSHRSVRHSLPHNEHLMTKSKHNNRRNSDYPGGGNYAAQFSQLPAPYTLDEAGYPPVTDGYTEVQEDYRHHQLAHTHHQQQHQRRTRDLNRGGVVDYLLPPMYDGNGRAPPLPTAAAHSMSRLNSSYNTDPNGPTYMPPHLPLPPPAEAPFYVDEAEREAMLLDLGPIQTEWFYELTARGALIVRVLFSREANNDKELTVKRGEVLEILDDSRKWWKARNIELQVAYVPHTIVAVMEHYQTLDELLTNSPCDMMMMTTTTTTTVGDDSAPSAVSSSQRFSRRELQAANNSDNNFNHHQSHGFKETKRTAKTAGGAFRYF